MSYSEITFIFSICLIAYAAYTHFSDRKKLQARIDEAPKPDSVKIVSTQIEEQSHQEVFTASFTFYDQSKLEEVSKFLISNHPDSDIEIAEYSHSLSLEAFVIKWCSKEEFDLLESKYDQVENEFNSKFNTNSEQIAQSN